MAASIAVSNPQTLSGEGDLAGLELGDSSNDPTRVTFA
jgi:hypothetical protein